MSAGGGIKINNIKVSGGADGKTPVFKIEDGYLFNSYDNGKTWHQLGKVKGEDGVDGEDGATGAKLVSQVLVGQDASGGNIYKQTFDDGTTAIFVAPKGEDGVDGEVTIATIEINNPNTTLAFKNLEGMTKIDWGDGTINSELTHTYENLGVYYCRIYGLVSIGEEAFKGSIPNHTPITHIKISNKVTAIGSFAFIYVNLRTAEIPNSVTIISECAFDSCFYLEKIVIPESVTYIDVDAFNMCSNLKIVELKGAPPQQIYSGDIFSFANKLEKIIVPYGMVEAYKSAPMWSDYAKLIDCLVYQSDLDTVNADLRSLIGGNTSLMLSNTERITAVEEKITENREEINKDIKNLYAITAQGGLYTMLEVEQAFSSRETADGESIVDGQYTAPTKIQGSTVKCKNLFDISKIPNSNYLRNDNGVITIELPSEGGTSITTAARLETVCPSLKVGDIVTLSFQQTNEGGTTTTKNYIHLYEAGITWTSNTSKTITQEMLDSKIVLYTAYYPQTYKRNVSSEFQIEYGSIATEYQPYFTGLKNAYFKGIKSTGKNLFDISKLKGTSNGSVINNGDGSVTVNTYSSTVPSRLYETCPSLKAGDLVTLSFNSSSVVDGEKFIYLTDDTVHLSERWMEGESKLLTENMINARITFYTNPNDKTTPVTLTNIQIVYGTTATAYESYKEDTYELSEAVELGEWDYIDVENKKVVRKTYELKLDGTQSYYSLYTDPKTGVKSILLAGYIHNLEGGKGSGALNVVYTPTNICKQVLLTGATNTGYTTIELYNTSATTVEEAKGLLAANPITLVYESFANHKTTYIEETPDRYQAWKNGSETVVQGDTDNSEYGAMPTVTTEYFKLTEV